MNEWMFLHTWPINVMLILKHCGKGTLKCHSNWEVQLTNSRTTATLNSPAGFNQTSLDNGDPPLRNTHHALISNLWAKFLAPHSSKRCKRPGSCPILRSISNVVNAQRVVRLEHRGASTGFLKSCDLWYILCRSLLPSLIVTYVYMNKLGGHK